ncbi:MAG: DNA mismatch repair protein MutS, partial [Acidobacteria bacterium]|nr:DNA mismatch repair protein MutS [Acidobacteriota bacterium]
MKAFLLYKDRDFGSEEHLPPNAADLTQDLELDTIFAAMAGEDTFLLDVAKKAVLASLDDPERILYRQRILADCLNHPDIIRQMYGIAGEAIEREKKIWPWTSGRYPRGLLHRSVDVLQVFGELLKRLRRIADEHGAKFRS